MNINPTLKVITACTLVYETIAIFAGDRIPTISTLCWAHSWLGPTILGALAFHLYYPIKKVSAILVETLEAV